MTDFDLQIALDRLAEAMLPDDELRQQKANAVVVSHDGGVHSRPLVQSLPWYRADVSIPGLATPGSAVVRVPFPQGATIRHISIFASTAPSAHSFNIRLNATGDSQRFSLQVGATSRMSVASVSVPDGSWLDIDVTQAGGAADITIALHYSPLPGGQ